MTDGEMRDHVVNGKRAEDFGVNLIRFTNGYGTVTMTALSVAASVVIHHRRRGALEILRWRSGPTLSASL